MSKAHVGYSLDDFLKEEGVFQDSQTKAVKDVVGC